MKYLQRTIEYGLYLLAFLLPLQTRWIIKVGITEYQTYSLYGTDILLMLVLLLFIIYKFSLVEPGQANFPGRARTSKFKTYFIFGLLAIAAVSVFFAPDKPLALYKFSWLILGAGLFWLVSRAAYNRVKFIWSLLLGMAPQAALAIWQFLTQSTFANKWLGMSLHRATELGASVIETVGADGVGERWLRAYGGLDHPNMLGGVMAVGVLLLVGEIIRLDKFLIFPGRARTSNWQTISLIFLAIFSAALFFSFSRSAWLALAVGLIAMLAGAAFKKNFLAQKNILQAILISGLVFFILFFQFSNLAMTRLYADERLEVKSRSERVESIKNSLPIIKNNWASGVGLGNYTLALRREFLRRPSYFYQPAHNVFILILSEIGIIGLIFFAALFFVKERRGNGENRRTQRNGSKAAILVALIIIMSLDHWLWSLHFGVLFFWLIMGLMARTPDAPCG